MTSLARALRIVRKRPQMAVFWEGLQPTMATTPRAIPISCTTRPTNNTTLLQHPHHCSCCRSFSTGDSTNNKDKDKDHAGIASEGGHQDDDALIPPSDASTDQFQIPGAQAGGKKLAIVYTCKVCNTRSIKQFSEHSYQNGVVLVRCPGCENLHLIADRLGIFDGDGDWDIQKAMSKLGENVNVVNNDNVLEMSLQDLMGQDALEKLAQGVPTTTEEEEDSGTDQKSS